VGILRFSIVEDFGMSWDEEVQRRHGVVSADYINQKCGECLYTGKKQSKDLMTYDHAHYGHLFSMLTFMATDMHDESAPAYRQVYLVRHRIVAAVFFIGLVFFMFYIQRRFKKWYLAVLGVLLFTVHPRIFAHSFYNPKDIILLSGFFLCVWSLSKSMDKESWLWVIVHAMSTGLLIGTRILGVLMIPLTLIFYVLYAKKSLKYIAGYFIGSVLFTILFWPYLWEDPVGHFVDSWIKMSQYPWEGDLLLDGVWYVSGETPWYYPLRWMMITIPLWILLPAVAGLIMWLVDKIRRIKKGAWFTEWEKDVPFGLFCAGILPVIVLGSTLYDGWRQLYFLAIPIAIWALMAIQVFISWLSSQRMEKKGSAAVMLGFIVVSFLFTSMKMVKAHPDNQVYFNAFAKQNKMKHYDLDYWGNAYAKAYEYMAENIDDEIITVSGSNIPAKLNAYYIPHKYQKKIRYVDDAWRAKYFISNWRQKEYRQRAIKQEWIYQDPIYIYKVGDTPLVGVYRNPYFGIDPSK